MTTRDWQGWRISTIDLGQCEPRSAAQTLKHKFCNGRSFRCSPLQRSHLAQRKVTACKRAFFFICDPKKKNHSITLLLQVRSQLTPVMSQEKRGMIFRYDFVVVAQIVPQKCLCDRIEKDEWDRHQGKKFIRGSVYL
jgi:hypothetical protein